MMRKLTRVIILGVLAVLVVLTFVSRTVYHRNLPQVSVVTASPGWVPLMDRQETNFSPRADWRVVDRLNVGDDVAVGDYVIWYDLREFDLVRREKELEIQRMVMAEENEWDTYAIELAQERLALWLESVPPYAVMAPHDGRIEYVWSAALGHAVLAIVNEERDDGPLFDYILPRDAIFQVMQSTVIYIVRERRGVLGMEDYLTAVTVDILRENATHAAVVPRNEGTELAGVAVARAVDGFVESGSVVWVRER